VSFRGRMVQYAGRLNREHAGKSDVVIYDYLDSCSGLTVSMYRKRLAAYKTMGYSIQKGNA
jgi:superfamily II DNA or RNA helicase